MNLTKKFEELAETPAPPMLLDIERARAAGRRRLYTRRATLFGGIAVAAGAAALTGPAIVRAITEPKPEPAAPPRSAGLLITYATFGWLPESLTRVEFGQGTHGDYAHAVNENEGLGTHMWLSVYPPGDLPRLRAFRDREQFTIPAPPVNGRTAYWVTERASDPLNGGDAFLIWQEPDRGWAELHAYYLNFFDDPPAVLHRVASDATVADRAQPLPVRITGMPDKFKVDEATFHRPMPKYMGTGAWALVLSYAKAGPVFGIVVRPEGSATEPTKVQPAEWVQECKASDGVEVCLTFSRRGDAGAIKELGGPQGVLDRFTPLGIDESRWVTN